MRWKIERNVLSELYFNSLNLIKPWGVETSDFSSFYSQEDGLGYRYDTIELIVKKSKRQYKTSSLLKLKSGIIKIKTLDEIVDANTIYREAELEAITDISLIDFVLRFRFKNSVFTTAIINNKLFPFKNTNLYHQYQVDSIRLEGKKYIIIINVEAEFNKDKWKNFLYARDRNDEWIVHARLLPTNYDDYVIKLCSKWFQTRPLNKNIAQLITKKENIKNFLTYHSEKEPYKSRFLRIFNPNGFPLARVLSGEKIRWKAYLEINEYPFGELHL